MRAVFSAMVVVGAVAILLAVGSQAQAMVVTSSAYGTEFYDNFEGALDVAGSPPNNGTLLGNWNNGSGSVLAATVTNAGSPGAYEGSQYLKVMRDPTPGTPLEEAVFQNGALTSGTLHMEWMTFIPTGTPWGDVMLTLQRGASNATWPDNIGFNFAVTGPPPSPGATTGLGTTGNITYYGPPAGGGDDAWTTTTQTVKTNTWQKWAVDVNLAAKNFVLSIDGVAGPTDPFVTGYDGNGLDRLQFECAGNGAIYYVDAVPVASPEPSTVVLLGTGLLGLLCYAWRKRK